VTVWELFVDLGIAGALLLVGTLLRSRVVPIQRLFLPASVIAGLSGLALGPQGADWLPFSGSISGYPGVLIALVFAALPFIAERVPLSSLSGRLTRLWAFSSISILLQWGGGIVVAVVLLRSIWVDLNPGFGTLIAVGFVGGHGTAAAVGQVFADLGWPEATSLAMMSATVGILSAVIGGMLWVRWAAATGRARHLTRFEDLPTSLRTGLVMPPDRRSFGDEPVSSSTIDTLAFHVSLIATAAVAGYYLSGWAALWFEAFRLPVFCMAFVCASLLRLVLGVTGAHRFVDWHTMGHLSGGLTDVLVVFGIASIRIAVLVEYALPLGVMMATGILLSGVVFRGLGPGALGENWLERSLFTWGWTTGVTAMGIALLRIVDPDNESDTLADFGIVYLFLVPVEVGLLAVVPLLLMQGQWMWLAGGSLLSAGVLVAALLRR
jgi:ESS family glutamate:Na+ symporter